MRDLVLTVEDYARFPQANAQEKAIVRSSSTGAGEASPDKRTISFIFSDESVARDGHTIASNGWQLDEFKANPVFLWAHDTSQPPVGRVTQVATIGKQLRGIVEFATREVYDFADTVYQLYREGYLNATSVSWLPVDWEISTDKNRPRGAVDFKRQTLLEISAVPVPALPTALATARSKGIDTGPLYAWAEKVLDSGSMIMVPRATLESLRKEAKMPTTPVRDGGALAATNAAPVPEPAKPDATQPVATAPTRATAKIGKRGLYSVSYLAMLLCDLGYLQESVEYEALTEADGSEIPARLKDALAALGQVLVDMTAEEVAELLADDDEDEALPLETVYSDGYKAKRAAFRVLRRMKGKPNLTDLLIETLRVFEPGVQINMSVAGVEARAGKTLSSKNSKALSDAHAMITQGCDMVRSVLDEADTSTTDGNDDDAKRAADIAVRKRRAAALKRKTALKPAEQAPRQ